MHILKIDKVITCVSILTDTLEEEELAKDMSTQKKHSQFSYD